MNSAKFGASAFVAIAVALMVSVDSFNANAAGEMLIPEMVFAGPINSEAVNKFLDENKNSPATKLIVFSGGGEFFASIKLARWVKQNELDVQVRTLCFSACANYVFSAGKRKTIESGSLVLWHGGAEQKNLRELQDVYEGLLGRTEGGNSVLTVDEKAFLANNRKKYQTIKDSRLLEAEFLREIGVDEYLSRLGQEPENFGIDAWTTSLRVMDRFGIRDVTADSDYGNLSYMRRNGLAMILLKGKLLTFDLDDKGEIVPTFSK